MYYTVSLQILAIYMYTIPVRNAIIICHCVELTWGNVVWDILALLCGTTFLVLISIHASASLFSLEVLKQQYVITYFNRGHALHVLLMYNYWWCHFLSCEIFLAVAPVVPLLKYTCYMWNRQRAHKSHRISSSHCSHDNILFYFTGICSLWWYDYAVYYTVSDGTQ